MRNGFRAHRCQRRESRRRRISYRREPRLALFRP
jgi:hypothetical protein